MGRARAGGLGPARERPGTRLWIAPAKHFQYGIYSRGFFVAKKVILL